MNKESAEVMVFGSLENDLVFGTETLVDAIGSPTCVLGVHSSLIYLIVPSQDGNIHVALGS
jgi:hypothetical protein